MASVTRARPLEGRTIVVTRASAQAQKFVNLLTTAGASVLATPTIAIEPPASWAPLDAALDAAASFTWLIFTSVNGVMHGGPPLTTRRLAWACFARARVAAIGPATAEAIVEHGLRVEIVPREYRAEGLVERLRPELASGDRVLLPRAAQTRDVLVRDLTRLGAVVTEVAAYTTRRVGTSGAALRHALSSGTADVVTFTSSSTARNFAELVHGGRAARVVPVAHRGVHRPHHRGHRRRVRAHHAYHAERVHHPGAGPGDRGVLFPRAGAPGATGQGGD